VLAAYLHKQADNCTEWARECFDLGTAGRLRMMAQDFRAKAHELESQSNEIGIDPQSHHPAALQIGGDAP
jgi:hypothetical protein